MRRDHTVQVEPDALPVMVDALQDKVHTDIGETRPAVSHRALPGGIHSPSDGSESPQAHPVSHRQSRDNAVLASMRLEREELAHRFANLAPNDAARITAEVTLKGYDERIARFEQMLQEER